MLANAPIHEAQLIFAVAIYANATELIDAKPLLQKGAGMGEAVRAKRVQGEASPVASVAAGDADVAFGPVSELLTAPGVDYAGRLPDDVQQVTVFAAAIPATARDLAAARSLIAFLASPEAAPAIEASGMEAGG